MTSQGVGLLCLGLGWNHSKPFEKRLDLPLKKGVCGILVTPYCQIAEDNGNSRGTRVANVFRQQFPRDRRRAVLSCCESGQRAR